MATDSLYPPDWRDAARKDWSRVSALLGLDDVEGAAFFLQQSPEKYLKAYLLGRGWKLRKVHLLHVLLDEAIAHESSLTIFRDLCERVAGYYLTERYPQIVPSGLQPSDLEKDREESSCLIRILFPDEFCS